MFPGFRSSSVVQGVFILNPVHTEHHKEILKSVSFTSSRGLWSNHLNSSVQIGWTSMGVRSLLRSAGTGPWIRNTGSSFSSRQHVGRDTQRLILNIATWEPPCAEVESIIWAWGRKTNFLCLPSSELNRQDRRRGGESCWIRHSHEGLRQREPERGQMPDPIEHPELWSTGA